MIDINRTISEDFRSYVHSNVTGPNGQLTTVQNFMTETVKTLPYIYTELGTKRLPNINKIMPRIIKLSNVMNSIVNSHLPFPQNAELDEVFKEGIDGLRMLARVYKEYGEVKKNTKADQPALEIKVVTDSIKSLVDRHYPPPGQIR